MKKKLLCILHIPPPVTGAGMVGSFIKDSKIINVTFDADYINLSSSFSLESIGKGGIGKIIAVFKILLKTIKAQLANRYDISYMTLTAKGPGFYKDFLVVVLLKLFGQNILYHFHNKGVKENSDSGFHRMLYRFVFRNTRSILLSPELYPDIEAYVKKEDVYFCPNGIPDIAPVNIEPVDNSSVCRFFFLSNMMKQKGVLLLLEACRILKERAVSFECHFVGAWSDVTEGRFHRTVERFDITDRIFSHGKKYGDDKRSYFKNADVFVFPTSYDCFPLVLLEAMQYSLAVLSTYQGGIPSIVEDGKTGILLDRPDGQDLADIMEKFVTDADLSFRMGKAGRQRYENHFTLSVFENRLRDIIFEAASNSV